MKKFIITEEVLNQVLAALGKMIAAESFAPIQALTQLKEFKEEEKADKSD
jgi:hypothetical protein